MSKLIAIRDGHGVDTPGKRTPKMDDGYVMKENEFNSAVANLLEIELKRCGFRTLQVAPESTDTSLTTGVNRANNAKADLFISIHANANTGVWGSWGGIETLTWGSGESLRIGKIIQKQLVQATKLRDRGMKDGSWLYEAKYTKMPFVLVECGFMDNKTEAKLLRSDAYRKTCAIAIAKGICEAYGVKYVSEAPKPSESTPVKPSQLTSINTTYTVKSGDSLWRIATNNKLSVTELKAINGLKSNVIHVGDKLIISKATIHTVVSGDTLWALSQKYGTTVSKIKIDNGLKSDVLSVGTKLFV